MSEIRRGTMEMTAAMLISGTIGWFVHERLLVVIIELNATSERIVRARPHQA